MAPVHDYPLGKLLIKDLCCEKSLRFKRAQTSNEVMQGLSIHPCIGQRGSNLWRREDALPMIGPVLSGLRHQSFGWWAPSQCRTSQHNKGCNHALTRSRAGRCCWTSLVEPLCVSSPWYKSAAVPNCCCFHAFLRQARLSLLESMFQDPVATRHKL